MTDIQVRGAGSLTASNGPLVVIDGIAGGDLRNMATQDVESITVLKDAGSAASLRYPWCQWCDPGNHEERFRYSRHHQRDLRACYVALNIQKPRVDILTTDEFRRSRRGQDYGADHRLVG